jgi:hypothetical protein
MISRQMRSLAILAALALAGCTVATLNLGATDYNGKPLSDVTAKLGQPNEVQTIAGQKAYIWNVGNTLYACQIRVVMAGNVVDTYEGSAMRSGSPTAIFLIRTKSTVCTDGREVTWAGGLAGRPAIGISRACVYRRAIADID